MTFMDGTVVSGKVVAQDVETYTFVDTAGTTNTAYKSEVKSVEFSVGEDRHFAAAREERDPAQQLILLEISIERFPKDRANFIFLTRCYLRDMDLEKAERFLTNKTLDNPGFDLLRVTYLLKSGRAREAEKALKKLTGNNKWKDAQRMEAELLLSFCLADQARYAEAQTLLQAADHRYGGLLSVSYNDIMAYRSYAHYRKSINSVVYLSKYLYLGGEKLSSLKPNLTRYYRRIEELPEDPRFVENIVIHESLAGKPWQYVMGSVGAGLLGVGIANGFVWAESSKLNPSANPLGTFLPAFSGLALGIWGIFNPAKSWMQTEHEQKPMHMRFESVGHAPSPLKISAGFAALAFLGASIMFAEHADKWGELQVVQEVIYNLTIDPSVLDGLYNNAVFSHSRYQLMGGLAIGCAGAAVLMGALYFALDSAKPGRAGLLVPTITPNSVALTWFMEW